MEKLIKKIKINTSIEVITGLHVGGSSDNVEIGGIDNPVIKIGTKDNQPYIPGSSLKGKMRCLLEQVAGSPEVGGDPKVNNLFGFMTSKQPSKLIVRDAYMTKKTEEMLKNSELDMPYTESKSENAIDRINGVANPRQSERVPAGAIFDAEFIINVWDDDNEEDLIALFEKGKALLENDYLGGSGSRGYGQIKFSPLTMKTISAETNWI